MKHYWPYIGSVLHWLQAVAVLGLIVGAVVSAVYLLAVPLKDARSQDTHQSPFTISWSCPSLEGARAFGIALATAGPSTQIRVAGEYRCVQYRRGGRPSTSVAFPVSAETLFVIGGKEAYAWRVIDATGKFVFVLTDHEVHLHALQWVLNQKSGVTGFAEENET